MNARALPYSVPMIPPIFADTKTQTRRVVRLQRWMVRDCMSVNDSWVDPGIGGGAYLKVRRRSDGTAHRLYCPYGGIGDRIWVKEPLVPTPVLRHVAYAAPRFSDMPVTETPFVDCRPVLWPWKVRKLGAMYCPRWASRLTLEITDVRVQRLQEISEEDARAEGIRWTDAGPLHAHIGLSHVGGDECNFPTAVAAYRALWEDINGDGSWEANPLVWALTFKRVAA